VTHTAAPVAVAAPTVTHKEATPKPAPTAKPVAAPKPSAPAPKPTAPAPKKDKPSMLVRDNPF
jgi:hypothetical protein